MELGLPGLQRTVLRQNQYSQGLQVKVALLVQSRWRDQHSRNGNSRQVCWSRGSAAAWGCEVQGGESRKC